MSELIHGNVDLPLFFFELFGGVFGRLALETDKSAARMGHEQRRRPASHVVDGHRADLVGEFPLVQTQKLAVRPSARAKRKR